MKIAVIEIGGKQYLVFEGQKIQIEKLRREVGAPTQPPAGVGVNFDKVLLVADGSSIDVGRPYIVGKKVSAEILEQKRLPKVTTFKYHNKTRYRVKKGHRQSVTMVKILAL